MRKELQEPSVMPVPKTEDWTLGSEGLLHASGTASPVAVVEVKTLALEDEGTEAILDISSVFAV